MARRGLIVVAACAGAAMGCSSPRSVSLVSALPVPCGSQALNELRLSGLGDFPPSASALVSATVTGDPSPRLELELPRDTRVITVEGTGAGTSAFGRTAALELEPLWSSGGRASVVFGPADTFCATASLASARSGHVATLLADGSVLVAGGVGPDGASVTSLERYLPAGDSTSAIARFAGVDGAIDPTSALGTSATLLGDGRVLLAGGAEGTSGVADGIAYAGAQLLDVQGRPDGAPRVLEGGSRAFHGAVALADGTVLLAGGCSDFAMGTCMAKDVLASATIYDPTSDSFTKAPALLAPRWGHELVLRDDGLVLVLGGRDVDGSALQPEIYDPTQSRGSTQSGPAGTSVVLDSGLVVGLNDAGGPTALTVAWSGDGDGPQTLPQLPTPREAGTVTALEDGTVLFAGGWDGTALVDGGSLLGGDGVTTIGLHGFAARDHSATRLLDGTVLLAGGADASGAALAGASIFLRSLVGPYDSPATLGFDSPMPVTPSRPGSASITDGALVVTGGTSATAVPEDFAVLSGPQLAGPSESGFSVELLASATPGAQAAILYGTMAEARYVAIVIAAGTTPTVQLVTPSQPGLVAVTAQAGCSGVALTTDELPATGFAPLTLTARGNKVELASATRTLLRCDDRGWPARGEIGLGSKSGIARFDNVTLRR